jgi:hypothetical protein
MEEALLLNLLMHYVLNRRSGLFCWLGYGGALLLNLHPVMHYVLNRHNGLLRYVTTDCIYDRANIRTPPDHQLSGTSQLLQNVEILGSSMEP